MLWFLVLAIAGLTLAPVRVSATPSLERDFSFGQGTPFTGSAMVGDVCVTLATTNTEPYGRTAFRDRLNVDPAEVTLTFSTPISDFHLDVSRVRADELLMNFNIGTPTAFAAWGGRIAHSLVNVGGKITTSRADDFGQGRLVWTGLRTDVVRFTIGNTPEASGSPALAIDGFGFMPIRRASEAGSPSSSSSAAASGSDCPQGKSPADAGGLTDQPRERQINNTTGGGGLHR